MKFVKLLLQLRVIHDLLVYTCPQMAVGYSTLTYNMTYVGSKYNYGRLFFCENEKHFTGSFGGPVVHRQKTLPNMGRMGYVYLQNCLRNVCHFHKKLNFHSYVLTLYKSYCVFIYYTLLPSVDRCE